MGASFCLLVNLIIHVATDIVKGPLRGAVLIHTQVVTLLTDGVIWLYSISIIALISLAKPYTQGTYGAQGIR
jgi:hypothetical protein